jgi:predicted Zn-ribbon and HTH transcriptional regulator
MSVSFIYNNLAFFYRIDSFNRSLPVIVWKCKDLPMVQGEAQSKEHMYEQIKSRLKQYHRNRALPKECDTCGLTSPKMEAQSTCPSCLIDNE